MTWGITNHDLGPLGGTKAALQEVEEVDDAYWEYLLVLSEWILTPRK